LFRLAPSGLVPIIDRWDNNVPKDATSTRVTILSAAVQTLQRSGVEGFTLDAVARRAGVGKGLILYHYASRGRLLRAAAAQIADARDDAIRRALDSGSGMAGVDACWDELRRQAEDGTARAWLSLCAAGLIDRSARNEGFEEVARAAVADGCAVALAAGVPLADARDAYSALWLALLEALTPPPAAPKRPGAVRASQTPQS
jgi:AcrR family transcriptional regulator